MNSLDEETKTQKSASKSHNLLLIKYRALNM